MASKLKPRETFKVLMVGDQRVRETLLRRIDARKHIRSGGIYAYTISSNGVYLEVWDPPTEHCWNNPIPGFYRDADAAIVIYDKTNPSSFQHVGPWIRTVRNKCGSNVKICLVGDKLDVTREAGVERREGESLARNEKVRLFETSVEEVDQVMQVFEHISAALKVAEESKIVKPEISFKVLFLGNKGVGKSTLIASYRDDVFVNEKNLTTGGTSFDQLIRMENRIVMLKLVDTQEELQRQQCENTCRKADAVVLMYDITDKQSLLALSTWHRFAKENCRLAEIFIVGGKSDLRSDGQDEHLTQIDVERWKRGEKLEMVDSFETSAKIKDKVNELFQTIAYRLIVCRDKIYSEIVRDFKAVIVGDSGVGKTTLLTSLRDGIYSEAVATVGVDTFEVVIKARRIRLLVWDIRGQVRDASTYSGHIAAADVAIVMYDLQRKDTFKNVDKWLEELRKHFTNSKKIFLVGGKSDCTEKEVTLSDVTNFTRAHNLIALDCFWISSKTNEGVDYLFEAIAEELLSPRRPQQRSWVWPCIIM